jgi:epoxyqueuosine reductase
MSIPGKSHKNIGENEKYDSSHGGMLKGSELSIQAIVHSVTLSEELIWLGTVPLAYEEDFKRFQVWLSQNRHGDMAYLENYPDLRANPSLLLPGSKTALIFGLPYYLGDEKPREGDSPRVAQYARLKDYHKVFKHKLDSISDVIKNGFPNAQTRTLVDSAPILERALAAQASRGFIGKNTCYIHPQEGSFLLLGEILTDLELPIDEPASIDHTLHLKEGGCGKCDRCQVNCPTGALSIDYQIDARLCLSYWTIEQRGPIPENFWPWLKWYYFGCDICQLVCPYNRKNDLKSAPHAMRIKELPSLFDTATMDQKFYEKHFGGTPLTRAKRNGLRRNALIAMKVTGDPKLSDAMRLAEKDNESPIKETLEQIRRYN